MEQFFSLMEYHIIRGDEINFYSIILLSLLYLNLIYLLIYVMKD